MVTAPAEAFCTLQVSASKVIEIRDLLSGQSDAPSNELTTITGADPHSEVSGISLSQLSYSLSSTAFLGIGQDHGGFRDIPQTEPDTVNCAAKNQVPIHEVLGNYIVCRTVDGEGSGTNDEHPADAQSGGDGTTDSGNTRHLQV